MPKKINYRFDDEYVKVYLGYYNESNIVLAICQDKELVKDYLEQNRKLPPKKYHIEPRSFEESFIHMRYEDSLLTDFHNFAIPLIDVKIIEKEYGEMNTELESVVNKMKYFSFLINNTKNSKEDLDKMITAIKIMEEFKTNRKKNNKLIKAHLLSHPILSCDINDYLGLLRVYREEKESIERYKYMCNKD